MNERPHPGFAVLTVQASGPCLHCALCRAVSDHYGGAPDKPATPSPETVRLACVAVIADLVAASPAPLGEQIIDRLGREIGEAILLARAMRAEKGLRN